MYEMADQSWRTRPRSMSRETVNAVVRALEDRHVLRAEQRSGSRWYELQHDRLIGPLRQADSTESLQAAEAALAISDLATARHQTEEAQRLRGDID
jgi:DNA-binding GntR family transcriptional regulator